MSLCFRSLVCFPGQGFRFFLLLVGGAVGSVGESHAQVNRQATWAESSGQVVLVASESWEAPTGVMWTFEKTGTGWTAALSEIPVTLGRKGTAVGLGLHRGNLPGPVKREGDGKAPAGVFVLESSFGTLPKPKQGRSRFPYRRTGPSSFWVDDPDSRYYNRWVEADDPRIRNDWRSAETLALASGLYDLVLVVGHNRGQIQPNRGSAIFLHRWVRPGVATAGCTAMEPAALLQLWKLLDPDRTPLLVQGPGDWLREWILLPEAMERALGSALRP